MSSDEFSSPADWREFVIYLNATNRYVLNEYWKKFIDNVVDTAHKRLFALKQGEEFVRGRRGSVELESEQDIPGPVPILPKDMGAPPKQLATDGRLNPEGIPYLYLGNSISTAIAELRPWIGAEITIGHFKLTRDVKIVNTTKDKPKFYPVFRLLKKNGEPEIEFKSIEEYSAEEKEVQVWGDINSAFSTPVSPNETRLKYIATQYLAEVLKTAGFDGILYASSLNKDGYNLVLFDPNSAYCAQSRKFDVTEVNYKYEESANPWWIKDGKAVTHSIKIIKSDSEGCSDKKPRNQ